MLSNAFIFYPKHEDAVAVWNRRSVLASHPPAAPVNRLQFSMPIIEAGVIAPAQDTQPVTAGFKLVPIEPTPKMVDATFNNDHLWRQNEGHNARNKRIYRAMLAAAPVAAQDTQDAKDAGRNFCGRCGIKFGKKPFYHYCTPLVALQDAQANMMQVMPCTCGNPMAPGFVHRDDGPCEIFEPHAIAPVAPQNIQDALVKAMTAFLDYYIGMVESGDCGSWNPETQPVVINCRAALALAAKP